MIEQRPGVSHAELAAATGIGRGVLYGVIRGLVERGEIERLEQPGGGIGYRRTNVSTELPPGAHPKTFTTPSAAKKTEDRRETQAAVP